jgi:hypothetical protein
MGAVVEVKYFNTFILKKTNNQDEPIWNGSFGIPEDIGGYERVSSSDDKNWAIEESRIRGGYNNTTVDFGVKAYIVEDKNKASFRSSSLIYSGIFNSRTGINQTNVFSVGEDITKTADPANASIQRLFAEDTNLVIFQENKVSRALIDKDAIYNAEGGGSVTSTNLVIGQIVPYSGEYGISKNPESFAVYGYAKYFSDTNNNCILRLSNSGIDEISSYGMKDYFRDEVNRINTNSSTGLILGGYDMHNSQYVVSTQVANTRAKLDYNTLSFDEGAKGWVSFFTFRPSQIFSINNKFYTTNSDGIWEHYSNTNRGNFYGTNNQSKVTVSFNAAPSNSKTFSTVAYEGANGWMVDSIVSDQTGADTQPVIDWRSHFDSTSGIYSYYEGEFVEAASSASVKQTITGTSALISASVNPVLNSEVSGTGIVADTIISSFVPVEAQAISQSVDDAVTVTSTSSIIPVGTLVSGNGIPSGTSVISFNNSTGELVFNTDVGINAGDIIAFNNLGILTVNNSCNFTENTTINFTSVTNRSDYETVFGTGNPQFPVHHAGFERKENKYVANLVNNSSANDSEVIWGSSMSGIKGFYALATFSTDTTTDPGGEKQLFSVESNFTINNGY